MKTKDQHLDPFIAFTQDDRRDDLLSIPRGDAEEILDEYAEEYAKAFLNWYLFGIGINDKDNGKIDHELLTQFKESLKK